MRHPWFRLAIWIVVGAFLFVGLLALIDIVHPYHLPKFLRTVGESVMSVLCCFIIAGFNPFNPNNWRITKDPDYFS